MADYSYQKYGSAAAPWALYREQVKSIVIGKDITEIGEFNFYSMTALEEVIFEEGSKLEVIAKGAFGYTKVLETITIPASVETIEGYAFYYADGLKTVEFEDESELAIIGEYAFRNSPALENVFIPNGVISIGASIYYSCGSVNSSVLLNSYAHTYMNRYGYTVTTR